MDENELDGMAAYFNAIRNPSRDDPNWPLPSFDARDWAEEFKKLNPDADQELMLTWFANALMRGYDEHAMRSATRIEALTGALRECVEALDWAICCSKEALPVPEWGIKNLSNTLKRAKEMIGE